MKSSKPNNEQPNPPPPPTEPELLPFDHPDEIAFRRTIDDLTFIAELFPGDDLEPD